MDGVDRELEVLRCPDCGGRVVWVWNKDTTGLVRCPNSGCMVGAVEPCECTVLGEDEI